LVLDAKDADLRDLDEAYIANRGSFFVLEMQGKIQGCVGVRRLSDEIAELKRCYIAQECRGLGYGRTLCALAIEDAQRLGYNRLRLDTTRKSQVALGLFRQCGFCEIARYNSDPFAEIFMEKVL